VLGKIFCKSGEFLLAKNRITKENGTAKVKGRNQYISIGNFVFDGKT
jgi:hypothetical protein